MLCRIHDKWKKVGAEVGKGDELGLFQFGGSSIIVAFQNGRIRFDQDLLDLSQRRIQISVEVGMSLGRAKAASNNYSANSAKHDEPASATEGKASYTEALKDGIK